MTHVNLHPVHDLDQLEGETRVPRLVRVATDSTHRRDQRQLIEDRVPTDIPRVENDLHSGERLMQLGSHEAVGISNKSNEVVRHLRQSTRSPRQRGTTVCATPQWSSTRATTKSMRSPISAGRW